MSALVARTSAGNGGYGLGRAAQPRSSKIAKLPRWICPPTRRPARHCQGSFQVGIGLPIQHDCASPCSCRQASLSQECDPLQRDLFPPLTLHSYSSGRARALARPSQCRSRGLSVRVRAERFLRLIHAHAAEVLEFDHTRLWWVPGSPGLADQRGGRSRCVAAPFHQDAAVWDALHEQTSARFGSFGQRFSPARSRRALASLP